MTKGNSCDSSERYNYVPIPTMTRYRRTDVQTGCQSGTFCKQNNNLQTGSVLDSLKQTQTNVFVKDNAES